MSDTGWWIRDAELNDAPELAVLMCGLGYETGRTEMGARLKFDFDEPCLQNICRNYGWQRLRDDRRAHISKL
jgi:hypothetical protein